MKTSILLIVLFSSFFLFGQDKKSFEGVIKYDIDYVIKDSSEKIFSVGNKAIVWMKGNNYRQDYPNSETVRKVWYIGAKNQYFTAYQKHPRITVFDCNKRYDPITEMRQMDSTEVVMDVECNIIQIEFKSGTVKTYYYDPNTYVDPKLFKKHKYASYNRFVKETKALYLKIIISSKTHDFIMTATSLEKKEVNANKFKTR